MAGVTTMQPGLHNPPATSGSSILLETTDEILLEDNSKLLLE